MNNLTRLLEEAKKEIADSTNIETLTEFSVMHLMSQNLMLAGALKAVIDLLEIKTPQVEHMGDVTYLMWKMGREVNGAQHPFLALNSNALHALSANIHAKIAALLEAESKAEAKVALLQQSVETLRREANTFKLKAQGQPATQAAVKEEEQRRAEIPDEYSSILSMDLNAEDDEELVDVYLVKFDNGLYLGTGNKKTSERKQARVFTSKQVAIKAKQFAGGFGPNRVKSSIVSVKVKKSDLE